MKLDTSLASIRIWVDNRQCWALIDTGCSQSLVSKYLVEGAAGETTLLAVDGRMIPNVGEKDVKMVVNGQIIQSRCLIMQRVLPGYEVILGMDVIQKLGGVTIGSDSI